MKEEILNEFGNMFGLNGLHAKPISYMQYEDVTDKVEEFISQSIVQALSARDEEWREKIEDYFKGLIHIPNPQATKDNLINLMK